MIANIYQVLSYTVYNYNSLFPDDETKVHRSEVKWLKDGACSH